MQDLIMQYKQSLKLVLELRENTDDEVEKEIYGGMASDLRYALEWMKTGRRPGNRRGIERKSVYEREIPFEPYWIQLRKDKNNYLEIEDNDTNVDDSEIYKKRLVDEMVKPLTDRQREILELVGNNYSYEEIAKLLGVHKGTVSRTVVRIKQKIKDEGWFMV